MFFELNNLSPFEIQSIGKDLLLRKFHRLIRMWYIHDKLPESLKSDCDVIPYFTPCDGHYLQKLDNVDEIDGVLVMQSYCTNCKRKSS